MFDFELFKSLQTKYNLGYFDQKNIRLNNVSHVLDEDIAKIDEKYYDLGCENLLTGKLGIVIMAGGMATRFGGCSKAIVPIIDNNPDITFLSVKLKDIASKTSKNNWKIPVAIMNSFSTFEDINKHLEQINWCDLNRDFCYSFLQSRLPRIFSDNDYNEILFYDYDEKLLDASTGSGDIFDSLNKSFILKHFKERGVEHILISNIDNIGANIDPSVFGQHINSKKPVSVEVCKRLKTDVGGCIAMLENVSWPVIIEDFRLPFDFDPYSCRYFNTNTIWCSLDVLDDSFDLDWFAVKKDVKLNNGDIKKAVQFERLVGQITEKFPSFYIEVDRNKRFLPIKQKEDLKTYSNELKNFVIESGFSI